MGRRCRSAQRPDLPIRDRSNDDHSGDWNRPPLQHPQVEVLRSVEHKRLPAVVGTPNPPRGISGAIRRAAFRYSESDWRHWLMLMGADRLNVVEGVVDDLVRGHVPNIPGEMGARAEWRHNPSGFVRKAVVVGGAALLVMALLESRKSQKPRRKR
jgi:hypothetical protein